MRALLTCWCSLSDSYSFLHFLVFPSVLGEHVLEFSCYIKSPAFMLHVGGCRVEAQGENHDFHSQN